MPSVLITTEAVREVPGKHLEMLRAAGYEVRYPAKNVLVTEDETLDALRGFVAVHAGGEPYTERVFAGLPELRVISRNGVGYDRIDVEAATRHGVAVAITPDANHQAVAEHALSLILAVARRIAQDAADCRTGNWRRRKVFVPLRGSTLGIVGLGRIGKSVAVRAAAFGMRLVAFEQFPDAAFARQYNIEIVDLDSLLAQSDIVTLHTPLTRDTRELINQRTIAKMKRGAILVNTARGGLVNEVDLGEALQSGQLAGAGLDVLSAEPPAPDHPLLKLDNVIVTPHVAAFDRRAIEDMAVSAAQNILDLLDGKWPAASLINPEVQARFCR
jgi:D-3-phosphoglycerate dehydrogenase